MEVISYTRRLPDGSAAITSQDMDVVLRALMAAASLDDSPVELRYVINKLTPVTKHEAE